MPWVGFEHMVPASARAKTVHVLDRSAAVTGEPLFRNPNNIFTQEHHLRRTKNWHYQFSRWSRDLWYWDGTSLNISNSCGCRGCNCGDFESAHCQFFLITIYPDSKFGTYPKISKCFYRHTCLAYSDLCLPVTFILKADIFIGLSLLMQIYWSNGKNKQTKLRGLSQQAHYTDRSTAACRRS
jgi:hypothetical protein